MLRNLPCRAKKQSVSAVSFFCGTGVPPDAPWYLNQLERYARGCPARSGPVRSAVTRRNRQVRIDLFIGVLRCVCLLWEVHTPVDIHKRIPGGSGAWHTLRAVEGHRALATPFAIAGRAPRKCIRGFLYVMDLEFAAGQRAVKVYPAFLTRPAGGVPFRQTRFHRYHRYVRRPITKHRAAVLIGDFE
jgi:hypothetical protein